jgi:hypothetical protein
MTQRWVDRDEAGQTVVLSAKAVADPGTHTWPNKSVGSRMHLEQRTAMCFIRTMDAPDECNVISAAAQVWKKIADPCAALTILAKLPGAAEKIACLSKLDARFFERQRLPMMFNQLGLIVKRVNV